MLFWSAFSSFDGLTRDGELCPGFPSASVASLAFRFPGFAVLWLPVHTRTVLRPQVIASRFGGTMCLLAESG